MSSDLLLHFDQPLDAPARAGLLQSIAVRFGLSSGDAHASCKAKLLFVPWRVGDLRAHQLLDVVRRQGYSARIVDL